MSSLLIKNAQLDGNQVNIFCENGRISSIGDAQPIADEVLDAYGCIAHPPLINAHTHAAMTLFRGNGDDLPLMEWLTEKIWPYEAGIQKDEIYWGTKLAIVEMIRSGTLFFNDMYWDFPTVARATDEMGIRGMLATAIIDTGNGTDIDKQMSMIEEMFQTVGEFSDRIQFAVGPHAIYTVSEKGLKWARDFAGEHGLVLHTHLSETEKEVIDCQKEHGCTPVEYLDNLGLLSDRFVGAHTVWLSEKDIETLGNHKAVCVHNPVSNMKLAVNGVYPYRKLEAAGAITAIATDGPGSNNNMDLLEELKIAALLQKLHDNDTTSLNAEEAIAMATKNPTKVFGLEADGIHEGGLADLILLDPTLPEMNPMHNLTSHLVYAANGSVVDSAVCDGHVVMEHRYIEGEKEIRIKANEAAERMFGRVDKVKEI